VGTLKELGVNEDIPLVLEEIVAIGVKFESSSTTVLLSVTT
jgi:hypothetical protein